MTETKLSEKLEESFVRCRDLEAPLADRLQAFANETSSRFVSGFAFDAVDSARP